MNEMTIRLDKNGAAAVPGGQLLLGYAGNRGNYRLRIEQRGEWKGLTPCAPIGTPPVQVQPSLWKTAFWRFRRR